MVALPQKAPVSTDIFSGTVSELTGDSLTVVRKVPARQDVIRRFLRDAQTKVEGPLRISARVTVRYASDAEGNLRALTVIVR